MIGLLLRRRGRRRMRALAHAGRRARFRQRRVLRRLLRAGAKTPFGREHDLAGVRGIEEFRERVPLDLETSEAWPPSADALWAYLARARDPHLPRGRVASPGGGPAIAWPHQVTDARALTHTDVRILCASPFRALGIIDAVERDTGRPVREAWPSWRGLVHGGEPFAPYAETMRRRAGRDLTCVEVRPALAAVQDREDDPSLALAPDGDVLFEFVPEAEPSRRLGLHEVVPDATYRVYGSAPGGLWARWTGARVRFTQVTPPRVLCVPPGLDAFGERLADEDVREAVHAACDAHRCVAEGATVLPEYPDARRSDGRHLWVVELQPPPDDLAAFAQALDGALLARSRRYAELRADRLRPPQVRLVRRGSFDGFRRRAEVAEIPSWISPEQSRHLLPH